MLNRVVLPVVIAGLILTFFVLEVSGRLPAFQAFACMATLWLAWRWLGPTSPFQQQPLMLTREKLLNLGIALLGIALALLFAFRLIRGMDGKHQRHGPPASLEHPLHPGTSAGRYYRGFHLQPDYPCPWFSLTDFRPGVITASVHPNGPKPPATIFLVRQRFNL